MKPKTLLSWSSGKDSAWTLHILREQDEYDVVGLITTFNEAADRVAMHAVRRDLVEAQAKAVGLPLWPVMLPWPCSNEEYERRMTNAIAEAKDRGVTHMAFGDLFLEDIRAYRERLLQDTNVEPLFPIWTTAEETRTVARNMADAGLKAVITCVDPKQFDPSFAGREWNGNLLAELPASVDPCGERGEFHTYCFAGPIFREPIAIQVGERVLRDGFQFVDVQLKP